MATYLVFDHKPDANDTDAQEFTASSGDGAAVTWARVNDANEDIARGNVGSPPKVWAVRKGDPVTEAVCFKVTGEMRITYTARACR